MVTVVIGTETDNWNADNPVMTVPEVGAVAVGVGGRWRDLAKLHI